MRGKQVNWRGAAQSPGGKGNNFKCAEEWLAGHLLVAGTNAPYVVSEYVDEVMMEECR